VIKFHNLSDYFNVLRYILDDSVLRVNHYISAWVNDCLNPKINFGFFNFAEIVVVSSLESMMTIKDVKAVDLKEFWGDLCLALFDFPKRMLPPIISNPSRKMFFLLYQGQDERIELLILSVTHNNWTNVLIKVSIMI
jgi:hypothetical protein